MKNIVDAHRFCSNNKAMLQSDSICGCFYCLAIFHPKEIKDWTPDLAALCPYCGIDSIISESSGFPITQEFLSKMHEYWF
ncbi:MAG: cytoplasmic protein [Clostridiales bacterium]|nr:cytoplasmic protein [Clostridiales bacterium]